MAPVRQSALAKVNFEKVKFSSLKLRKEKTSIFNHETMRILNILKILEFHLINDPV